MPTTVPRFFSRAGAKENRYFFTAHNRKEGLISLKNVERPDGCRRCSTSLLKGV